MVGRRFFIDTLGAGSKPHVVASCVTAASLIVLTVLLHPSALQLEGAALLGRKTTSSSTTAEPLLQRVFVCVTFHFDVKNLSNLKLTLFKLTAYPTLVHVCVASDKPRNLKPALARWAFPGVELCDLRNTSNSNAASGGSKFAVTWYHRAVMQAAVREDYTSFMLLEDDLCPSWSALLSWARESPLLERHGFQRCFYRTEYRPQDGQLVMLDQQHALNITAWDRFVSVHVPLAERCNDTDHVRSIIGYDVTEAAPTPHEAVLGDSERCVHQHYIQLPSTYQGFWVASKALLQAYINSRWWDKKYALHAHGPGLDRWHVPERANGVIQFVNLPDGWNSACLIPWVLASQVLAPIAMVEHERLRYAVKADRRFARVPYANYLIGHPPVLHINPLTD